MTSLAARVASGPTRLPVDSSSSPPVSSAVTPGWSCSERNVSSPFVSTVRSRTGASRVARRCSVDEASMPIAPPTPTRSISLSAIRAFARECCSARAANCCGPTATAPPRTRWAMPSSTSTSRSRRIVISLTSSSPASCTTRTRPSTSRRRRISPRRSMLSRFKRVPSRDSAEGRRTRRRRRVEHTEGQPLCHGVAERRRLDRTDGDVTVDVLGEEVEQERRPCPAAEDLHRREAELADHGRRRPGHRLDGTPGDLGRRRRGARVPLRRSARPACPAGR